LRDRIRILTFSTLYPNEVQPNHGIFVENRLRHLIGSGAVEAVVVAPTPYFPSRSKVFGRWADHARVPRVERRNGLAVYHPRYVILPAIGMSLAPAQLAAGSFQAIRRLCNSGCAFDLIDAHYVYPDGVAAIWLGKWFRKPVVVTARGTDINFIPRFRWPRRLIQRSLAKAAGIITVSQALKEATAQLGIAPNNVTVIRNGVDLERFRPLDRARVRKKLAIHGVTLLSVGHLIERKGHDLVIRALAELANCQLVIVGEGPERGRLEALAESLGVASRVRLVGAKQHDELAQYYTAADALVLASSREGWANVLLEAMACGTPVVASNVWGNPEVVAAPAAGRLMHERSPQGIVAAVQDLFASQPDRNATRRYAEKFSWDETTRGQLQLFGQILSRATSKS
jgi:teichuronic acid biosynthesis glycosyltransferase TuaC